MWTNIIHRTVTSPRCWDESVFPSPSKEDTCWWNLALDVLKQSDLHPSPHQPAPDISETSIVTDYPVIATQVYQPRGLAIAALKGKGPRWNPVFKSTQAALKGMASIRAVPLRAVLLTLWVLFEIV